MHKFSHPSGLTQPGEVYLGNSLMFEFKIEFDPSFKINHYFRGLNHLKDKPMKKLRVVSAFSIFWLILGLGNSFGQQTPPPPTVSENFAVYNKTQCTTQVIMHCSDASSTTQTMVSQEAYYGACPTNEFLCFLEIVFPNMNVITTTLNHAYPGTPACMNPGENTPVNSCYSIIDWRVWSSGYITCNFY